MGKKPSDSSKSEELAYDPAIPVVGIYVYLKWREIKIYTQKLYKNVHSGIIYNSHKNGWQENNPQIIGEVQETDNGNLLFCSGYGDRRMKEEMEREGEKL